MVGYYGFTFPNLSEYEWIFTKLGIRIDVLKIWVGIANGQIRQFLTDPPHRAPHDTIVGIILSRF